MTIVPRLGNPRAGQRGHHAVHLAQIGDPGGAAFDLLRGELGDRSEHLDRAEFRLHLRRGTGRRSEGYRFDDLLGGDPSQQR